ncbi:flavodoxin family protein [Planctomycetota bacterium]
MSLKVLGISTSPRINGNTDLLLKQALDGAESAGATIEYINLGDYTIGPCTECNECYRTGICQIGDDYQLFLEKIHKADRLIFATPIFFMNVCAQAKTLIDRAQCLWAHKYILEKELFTPERDHRGMVIAVGGSKSVKQFDSIRWTMKTYFSTLGICYVSGLYIDNVDVKGAIEKHPAALKEAYRLGCLLAIADSAIPEKPTEVKLNT